MLKLVASSQLRFELGEGPADLRDPLREQTGERFRRVNRYIEMSLLGATRCVASLGMLRPATSLLMCTDAGMLADTAKVMDGMARTLRAPTPFEFMNLSGSMAGFHVAAHLRLQGAQLSLFRNHAALEAALQMLMLKSRRERSALVGFVEEGCWPLDQMRERLKWPEGALTECSHWLYFDQDAAQSIGGIERCTSHADLADLVASLAATSRQGLWLAGTHLSRNTAPLGEWAALLGVQNVFETDVEPLYSGGRVTALLAEFCRRHPGESLLHVNQSGEQDFHAILLRPAKAFGG